MKILTIGFTKKTAEQFFEALKLSGAKKLIDVRLNNVSQLAGFSKRDDLRYFLEKICNIEYIHSDRLAPTQKMLDEYRKNHKNWAFYEGEFRALMRQRKIEQLPAKMFDGACMLCSEHTADRCHRRLVAEHLAEHWGNLTVKHL